MRTKKMEYETVDRTISADGNVLESKSTMVKRVEQEPSYVKLYLDDICLLNDLPKTSSAILNELLNYSGYNNKIALNVGVKKEIIASLDITKGHLDNTITKLTKTEILKRVDTGLYLLNPFIFGKGKWTDIKEIRTAWIYNKNGRTLDVEIDYNQLHNRNITDIDGIREQAIKKEVSIINRSEIALNDRSYRSDFDKSRKENEQEYTTMINEPMTAYKLKFRQ